MLSPEIVKANNMRTRLDQRDLNPGLAVSLKWLLSLKLDPFLWGFSEVYWLFVVRYLQCFAMRFHQHNPTAVWLLVH
jgi:hypothetical protein